MNRRRFLQTGAKLTGSAACNNGLNLNSRRDKPAADIDAECKFIVGVTCAHGRSKVEQVTGLLSGLIFINSMHK